jgi:hypothetical protein
MRIADAGGKLEPGDPVTNRNGLRMPLWVAADAPRNRVLIREAHSWKNLATIDLASGKLGSLPLPGLDMAVDGAGNIYVSDDVPETGKSATFSRYTPDGKPLPFAATGGKLSVGVIRAYGGIKGVRGHCVAPNGDLYMLRSCYSAGIGGVGGNVGAVVDQYGADGKPKKTPALNNIGYGDCGLGVDAAGNIYVGSNLKRKEQPIPEPLAGKVPAEPWLYWRKPREGVWNYPYYNPGLFHLGAVLKFGPEGGTFYGMKIPDAPPGTGLTLADAPAGAVSLQSGYLAFEVKVAGMKWMWGGYGFVPTSDTNWGDPSCVCMTSRLAVDEYGRVFAPAAFLYGVQVLDTNGNPICRIGRYGNADSAGPGSRVPEPEIAFAWPALVSISGARVFVVDRNNRRVTVVKFDHAAEETCEIK